MASKAEEDAESNGRLLSAMFGGDAAAAAAIKDDPNMASHLKLDYDDDGEPLLLRFVYVDEQACIGCTYCADVARNTFLMEDDAGRARAFLQGGDEPEVIMEAIDTCPVMCISFVDHEDLVTLETERDGLDGTEGIRIGHGAAGLRHGGNGKAGAPTKAKLSTSSMICCNNCPSKGCKDCPMYGVGLNPVYIERMELKQAKKEATGEAAVEQEEAERDALISVLNAAPSAAAKEDEDEDEDDYYYYDGADDLDEDAIAAGLTVEGLVEPSSGEGVDTGTKADVLAALFGGGMGDGDEDDYENFR